MAEWHGARKEAAQQEEIAQRLQRQQESPRTPAPARLYVAVDGAHVPERRETGVVLGDGAPVIWELASMHYPQAPQILDVYHASEHLHAVRVRKFVLPCNPESKTDPAGLYCLTFIQIYAILVALNESFIYFINHLITLRRSAMKKLVGSLTALCLCAAFAVYAAPATYYIGPAGSDANDGLSPATAFGTFLTATEQLVDGGTLIILAGVYTNPANRLAVTEPQLFFGQKTNGTFLSGVTFKGEGPDKTIFYADAAGPVPNTVTNARIVRFLGTNNKVESMAIKGALVGADGNSWWYPVVYVINNFSGGVISNLYIQFPDSSKDRTGISPVWNNSVTNLLVTHCLVDGGGIGVKDFNNGCYHYTTFRNCTLVNQRDNSNTGRGIGVVVEGNDGTVIKNCIMMNQTQYAISLWPPAAGVATATVANCIWYNNPNGFLQLSANTVANESGTLNVDPNLQTNPLGLPYCSPLTYASYGWRVVPEPTVGLVLGLLALAGLRRK